MDMEMPSISKEYQKKKDVMAKRLSALGKDNPIVAKAVKAQQPPMEDTKWKEWQIVDELVSAARREYFDKEGGNMSACISSLADALEKLSTKLGVDKKKAKGNNVSNEEDY